MELWQYFIIDSERMGIEWHPTDEQDVFEQVIVRKSKQPGLQSCFYTFPDLDEYRTKDLYKLHPQQPNHWIYYGRADNIIVFSNGEKLNPITIERIVEGHPGVKGAVVVGSNKFQPALFIEPATHPKSEEEEKEFLDDVWPHVVRANKETVAHGQIGREFLTLTNPAKPFPRAGKGTVQRAGAIKLYKSEIEELYERVGQVSSAEAPKIDVSSEDALVESIEKMFETHLGSPHLEPDTDFFAAGIDSMQVINASRLLRAGLEAAGHPTDGTALATRVVYGNPTPRLLAKYLMETLIKGESKDAETQEIEQQNSMKHLYEQYTRDMVTAKKGRPEAANEDQVVVVTGTTGTLGSYLLNFLAHDSRIKKVICLNRAEDGGAKQQAKAAKDRGLDPTYGGKAEFYHFDVSRSDFALSKEVYDRLLQETDRWIHNAWPVNFNITVETFSPQLRGVRNIADFAATAAKRVAVVFISSIGTVDRWDAAKQGPVPEARLNDFALPSLGYGRSKLLGSLILEDAAQPGDFPAAVIRVGQIAGPQSEAGAWNRHEWLPSIIASSLYLRALPTDLGIMSAADWTPVESIAGLVLEVAGATQAVAPAALGGYYHGVNPQRAQWATLAAAVRAYYGADRLPELVSFKEWLARLEQSQSDGLQSIDANPAVKLIDSYRGMSDAAEAGAPPVEFAMDRTVARSPTMRNAKAITPELMQLWCKQWNF
jgi:thioester reductase-like protein